jgi:hypothetical protein
VTQRDGIIAPSLEQMGEADPIGLRGEAQEPAVGIEGISAAGAERFKAALLTAVEESLGNFAVHPEHEVQGIRAEMRNGYHLGADCLFH